MEARFMIESPQKVKCTLKLTMTCKEWEELRDQLSSAHPSWKLSRAISDILCEVRKVYYAPENEVEL